MNPEEKQQFEEMKKEIDFLKSSISLDSFDSMLDILITGTPEVEDTDVDRTITIGMGSEQVLDYPDIWLNFNVHGQTVRVGGWLKKNDSAR